MLNAIAHQIYILIPFNFTVYIRFSVFIVDAFEDTFLLLLLTHHPPSEMTNFIFKCNNPLMFVIKMFFMWRSALSSMFFIKSWWLLNYYYRITLLTVFKPKTEVQWNSLLIIIFGRMENPSSNWCCNIN